MNLRPVQCNGFVRAAGIASLSFGVILAASLGRESLGKAAAETKDAKGVTHFDAKEIAALFAKGGMIQTTAEYKVMAGHRDKGGVPELHDADTDVFYILDGDATFVTGGKIIDPKLESAGETRGTRIEGGDSKKLTKGDVIVIPRGVPHWFSEVPKMVNYFVVKVTAEKSGK